MSLEVLNVKVNVRNIILNYNKNFLGLNLSLQIFLDDKNVVEKKTTYKYNPYKYFILELKNLLWISANAVDIKILKGDKKIREEKIRKMITELFNDIETFVEKIKSKNIKDLFASIEDDEIFEKENIYEFNLKTLPDIYTFEVEISNSDYLDTVDFNILKQIEFFIDNDIKNL